jgi:hypothetical protein
MAVVLAAGAASAPLASRAEAREPNAGIALPENYTISGEPGEDPHLKTIPTIYIVQETDGLGASAVGSPVLDECSMSAEGTREGCGRGLGSRVNRAWRVLLRTWLWHWHR